MSHKFNPAVPPYIPWKVEVAAKVLLAETLTHPLPPKPLAAQSSYAKDRLRAREIAKSRVTAQCATTLGSTRDAQYPPAAPSNAFLSKRYFGTSHNQNKQRASKKSFFNYPSTTKDISHTQKQLPGLSCIPAMNGNLTDRRREAPRGPQQISAIEKFRKGAKDFGFSLSPYIPETAAEYQWHRERKNYERGLRRLKAKKRQAEEAECPSITNYGKKCMGGKTFASNHSAVLAIKTMWCPRTWPDEQRKARWPFPGEYTLDGWERYKNGYGRFLPMPRSEDFEWRLATREWFADPEGTKYPIWDGKGPIPVLEKSFAPVRGELDCIIGSGRWVNEEFLFGRAEETAWEDAADIIGKKLWEAMADDENNDLEEMDKVPLEDKDVKAEDKKMTTKEDINERVAEEAQVLVDGLKLK